MDYSREICEYVLTNELVKIDESSIYINYNNLGFDNKFISLYSDLVNNNLKRHYSNTVILFKETTNLALNTVLSWRFNLNSIIVKKNPCLKNCSGINIFLERYKNNDNITLPILKFPETDILKEKYKLWIKFIIERFKPKNLCVLVFFDVNLLPLEKQSKIIFTNSIIELCNEDTNIYFDKVINIELLSSYLEQYMVKQTYEKFKLYLENNNKNYAFRDETIVMNKSIERYIEVNTIKKSKICVSLEHIENYEQLIKFANLIGPYIHSIKINSNMIYNDNIIFGLNKLSKHHNFCILDDKKIELSNEKDFVGFKKISNLIDIISIKLINKSEDLTSNFEELIKINPNLGFALYPNENIDLYLKYYSKYILGIIGENEIRDTYLTIIDYKKFKNNVEDLKSSSLIMIGNEIYQERNPIEILQKINKITV